MNYKAVLLRLHELVYSLESMKTWTNKNCDNMKKYKQNQNQRYIYFLCKEP